MTDAEKWEIFREVANDWALSRKELTLCAMSMDHAFMQMARAEMNLQRLLDNVTGKHDLPDAGRSTDEQNAQLAAGISRT